MTASPWINCSATDLYDISVIIIIIIVMTSDKLPPNKYVNGQMAATTSGPGGLPTNYQQISQKQTIFTGECIRTICVE